MNIELNPKLVDTFNAVAQANGMTPEAYAAHVLEKYAVSQMRSQAVSLLHELTVDELEATKTDIANVLDLRPKPHSGLKNDVTP